MWITQGSLCNRLDWRAWTAWDVSERRRRRRPRAALEVQALITW